MRVELNADEVLLSRFARNLKELEAAGVKVKLVLESDDFEDVSEEEGEVVLKVRPKRELVEAFEKLSPAAHVSYSLRTRGEVVEYGNVEVCLAKCPSVEVTCPLCGERRRYCYSFPAVEPPKCPGCGAEVLAEWGYFCDVVTKLDELLPDGYSVSDGRVLDEEGREVYVVKVDEETFEEEGDEESFEGEPVPIWFVFRQVRSATVNAEDVRQVVEGGKTVKGIRLTYDGEYVVKKVKPMGKDSGGTYLPKKWIGHDVLVLKLP